MSIIKELKAISNNISILYVEDEKEIANMAKDLLSNFFDDVYVAYDGEEALDLYKKHYEKTKKYIDIVISDIVMPNMNGVTLSKEILNINESQQIIVISAYSESSYLIDLINVGASHFLSKPVENKSLINALHKCCKKIKNLDIHKYINLKDGFIWDIELKTLLKNDKNIKLTKNEKNILDLFLSNPNQIFSDATIFNTIYFDDSEKDMSKDSIKSIIKRLRKKLPQDSIENIYGDGYKIILPH